MSHRQNENVRRLTLQAEQGAINFNTSTVTGDGISGTLAAVLAEHNLTPQDVWHDPPFRTFAEASRMVDQADDVIYVLVQIFPELEDVVVRRSLSPRDGGYSYDYAGYRCEWQPDKRKWMFYRRTL